MPDLIAQGAEPHQRWRRVLPDRKQIVLGRSAGPWTVAWDQHVSRRHAALKWTGRRLEVTLLPEARNPIFFGGRETPQFALKPGEHFIIGQTRFTLTNQRVNIPIHEPQPVQQQSFSSQYLKEIPFRNADYRIEVLSRLPEVISGASSDSELFVGLVNMLLAGVPRADTVAVVAVEGDPAQTESRGPKVRVLHWDQRSLASDDFRPSQRLILEALRERQSVLHVWRGSEVAAPGPFTQHENYDWAFCTPVLGRACAGWTLYVAGRFHTAFPGVASSSDPTDLKEDLKFTELAAATLSSLRQMRLLERQHTSLSQFLSPVVLETLTDEDPDFVLAPRETEVSVLFCDLRGFSREAEQHSDQVMGLLQRVSNALGVMTRQILEQGGVVGDFQGDAAMGFWGWPLAQEDFVVRACRAALAIRAEFAHAAQDPDSHLAGFRMGIGIATGKAVAGKIGTVDQVKVTVFGPVVNLASRLEGMTKILRAPILLDEPTAAEVRTSVPAEVARTRRLAVVKPYGMDSPVEVSELLPPESEYPQLAGEHLAHYEAALDAFIEGAWSKALQELHHLPTEDEVTDFLTVYIAQHNRIPPAGWDGVIKLSSKS